MKIRTPVQKHHFLQAEFGKRQVALKSDVNQAMTQNTTTLGRQSHRAKDLVEIAEKAVTPPESKSADSTVETPKENQALPEQDRPPKEELFENFLGTMTETLGKEASVELLAQARELASEDQLEPCLAVLAHGVAKRTLQARKPGRSKRQIREAAEQDPELAGMLKLADSAKAYLKARKQSPSRDSEEKQGGENGYHLAPEKQVDLMAKNQEAMQKVQATFARMAEAQRQHLEELHKIRQETNRYLNELWLQGHKNQAALQDKYFMTFIEIIRGPATTTT